MFCFICVSLERDGGTYLQLKTDIGTYTIKYISLSIYKLKCLSYLGKVFLQIIFVFVFLVAISTHVIFSVDVNCADMSPENKTVKLFKNYRTDTMVMFEAHTYYILTLTIHFFIPKILWKNRNDYW